MTFCESFDPNCQYYKWFVIENVISSVKDGYYVCDLFRCQKIYKEILTIFKHNLMTVSVCKICIWILYSGSNECSLIVIIIWQHFISIYISFLTWVKIKGETFKEMGLKPYLVVVSDTVPFVLSRARLVLLVFKVWILHLFLGV